MEDVRDGDLRVPLISSILCIFVLAGGVFLTLYAFAPDISQPWFPVVALILIGLPWAFWLFTYLYTCIKRCLNGGSSHGEDHNWVSDKEVNPMNPWGTGSSSQKETTVRTISKGHGSTKATGSSDEKRVHFGEVVVVESDGSQVSYRPELSTNSAKLVELDISSGSTSGSS